MSDPRCTCGHLTTVHALRNRVGHTVRGACSAGGCTCALYRAGLPEPEHCPTCGSQWDPIEAARREQ